MSGPGMICSEDAMMLLVRRIEDLAVQADKGRRMPDMERRVNGLRHDLDRHHRDLKAAEAKILEWAEYAGQLRSAINAIDPKATKSKRIVLPDMPKPLETDAPF